MKKRPWRTRYKIWILYRDGEGGHRLHIIKKPSQWEARESAEAYCQERYPEYEINEVENGHKWIVEKARA